MHPTPDDPWAEVSRSHCVGAGRPSGDDGSGSLDADEPAILEEIEIEDLSVDGICGVY